MAKAAEFREMHVGNVRAANGSSERVAIELRIVARFWDGANVNEAFDAVGFEQGDEFGDGTIGVADGEDERLHNARLHPRFRSSL